MVTLLIKAVESIFTDSIRRAKCHLDNAESVYAGNVLLSGA